MSKILGIDLGTTFSVMAVIEAGEPKIIENKEGARITPSMVTVTKNKERLVGILARRQAITNPENTIFSVKRLIGRKFSDPEVQKDKKILPYEIRETADGGVEVKMGEKFYKPVEISAMILQKLKQDAEEKLGEKIDEAIITCPAYFDDSQRKATKVAGEVAGFKVRRIINEPTAAALAYGLTKKRDHQIIVYDFGGGTFDISVLSIGKDTKEDTIEVKATGGNTHLGGDDFDQRIMNWIVSNFKKDQGIDLSKDSLALQRIKEAGEKAKIELSSSLETEINLPFVTSDAAGPKHLLYKLTRAHLENMVSDYIEESIGLLKKTLKEANLKPGDIEEIVLVGGQTRMPKIQEEVKKFFGKEPYKEVNPDEVVAIGAAVEAGILQGEMKEVLLLDVTPLSLGIETLGGVSTVLIPKNTTVPTSKTQIFSTAADSQPSVEIHVLQGERSMATDNKSLGRFMLDGIPPAPRGIPQIEVSFDIDTNGILNVSAKDKATGKSQSIRIEGSCGLSKEEVEKMKKEAEIYTAQDQQKKELVEARNLADNLIYTSEKTLKEGGDKISQDSKKEIEEKIADLKKVKDSDNIGELKSKTQELSQAIQKIGAEMYKAAKGKKPGKEKPEEGEYKEKND
ncbi:molecular chaperone DnaK [bacterium (Candidatus Gribaldobacteria) CG_4_9_14_3_um_filter_36_15]|uniref:Chaperone protein DnaK n=4 Tax=Candidatus Gribaldobacteria TaxID=2798536 RepID=A0A2M7VKE8_9BACT|nr:MAG: molecular chaperone DnaK [Parcubacteria group bacterium CG2_30_36_21]PIR91267.1 MAG: molecular chaperone DnaK [bacterium (Candidatus Gribaldobacteria) CG10_big_fil_rev_8_21_14_0_10_37_46]PIV14180.1 MAG: molecular chaperone DnaK [bacterium (Candidatus Gribaldobacteria) CG03_land_8_20_14_0_80_36_40]PJA02308.1 MAG: molecular chaperone DnaK [bacterium (Candidatus Gribaldobacteria) CG_4_10_14_0_2_um_filter_36_18]PJB09355.1 MAG: molecular chaperone DnaK [bacterium (Candidatus Gribaldobacteria